MTSSSAGIRPKLSVVILCYRAEDFVPEFVGQMEKLLDERGLSYELVLVANYRPVDAERDRTPAVARALARTDPRLTVVARPKEGMMGWDMRSGLAAASGEAVAVIDGDGQMPASDVLAVYDCLVDGGHDMAKTYRRARYDGAYRAAISHVYNGLLGWLFPSVRVRDANGKPKIFRRAALERLTLTSSGWFIDAEIVIQASQLGFSIGEVPTVFYENLRRPSFVRPRAILEFIGNLLRYRVTGRCR